MEKILNIDVQFKVLLKDIREMLGIVGLFVILWFFWFYCYWAYAPEWNKVSCGISYVHKQIRWCSYTIGDTNSFFNRHIDKCFYTIPWVVEKDPTVSETFSELAKEQYHVDGVALNDWIGKCLMYDVKDNKLTNRIRFFDSFHCYFFNMLQYITPKPREWVIVDIG